MSGRSTKYPFWLNTDVLYVTAIARHDVLMEALRQLLVVVHDHRILLARLIVGRIGEHHLQLVAALVRVRHQDLLAPRVVALERVGVRHLLRVASVGAGDEEVRRLLERLLLAADRRRRSSALRETATRSCRAT